MEDLEKSRREFWDQRATLGVAAGTNDLNLKKLEIEHISSFLNGCATVLDAGCGNGITAIEILKRNPKLKLCAFDYSEAMVIEARKNASNNGVADRFQAVKGDLMDPPFSGMSFDAVYSERSLINLDSHEQQMAAIRHMLDRTRVNGCLILCESFDEGLEEINAFRAKAELAPIARPWHNRYLSIAELSKGIPDYAELGEIRNFSSTYYFLSRVVNAWCAKRDGIEPSYDAAINKLALSLPSIEICAQTKIAIITKKR